MYIIQCKDPAEHTVVIFHINKIIDFIKSVNLSFSTYNITSHHIQILLILILQIYHINNFTSILNLNNYLLYLSLGHNISK